VTPLETLQSLLVATHRLTQLAAQATGSVIPSATWRALATLENDGAHRLGELAAANRVTQPGMSRLVATMLEEGYVARRPDPEDSRASLIELADDGRAALRAWREAIAGQLAPRFADLDADDWATLERAAELLAGRTAEVAA